MAESYEERRARRAAESAAANERDPEKLKKWYELAAEGAPDLDIKPEDPDKEIQASARTIDAPRKERKRAASTGGVAASGFDENIEVDSERVGVAKEQDRHLRPIIHRGLGEAGHRQIYGVTEATRTAQEQGRSTPTADEIEQHSRAWDAMPDDSKHFWQQSPHGKKATEEAIANLGSQTDKQKKNLVDYHRSENRRKIVDLAFGSPEAAKAFKTSGVLNDEDGNPERDWKKPWGLVSLTSQQQGVTASNVLGKAIHTDPQHHQGLSDHIDELVRRSSSSAPANLQGNQFNVKEGLANAAKEALARSAMAHALGMKDAAISHFRTAVTHAGDLAQAVHGVNSQPLGDWDKQEGIQSKYVKSVNEAK